MKRTVIVVFFLTISYFSCSAQTASTSQLQKQILKEALASEEYKEAFILINKNKSQLSLAMENRIPKAVALAQYNEALGIRTGKAKTVAGALKVIKTKGDAYLKFVLYNKASEIALQKAADKNSEAEQLKNE